MSLEFCKKGINRSDINLAVRQEEQIRYLVVSDLQETELSSEYMKNWAERKYQTNDYFLNFLKSIFKEKNFLLFAKFLRKPLPSARVVNTKIRPQLERVFVAEDAETNYNIIGADQADFIDMLDVVRFNEMTFEELMISHNSIVITEPTNVPNTPVRYFVGIKNVTSIEEGNKGEISRISFKTSIDIGGKKEKGYEYIDSEKYIFYPFNDKLSPIEIPHDLGYCPAHFVSQKRFNGNFVIRESIFTFIREQLEDYNMLVTLKKMVMPNGVIPIVKKLQTDTDSKDQQSNDPKHEDLMGGQQPNLYATNPPVGEGTLSAGTQYNIPPVEKDGGGFDMEIIKNFILFDYLPVEPLEFLVKEIAQTEKNIVSALVGDTVEGAQEGSKNELQIEKSITVLDNTLTAISRTISGVRANSDRDMLNIKYGKERVNSVFVSLGTDFMIDSVWLLYGNLDKAPNAIERENILVRINQNRYKNNPYQYLRSRILYDLIPFVSDGDFDKAKESGIVDEKTLKLQIQFNFWISRFEALYGDIVDFYKNIPYTNGEKIFHINDLLTNIIQNESSTLANRQSTGNG